MAKECIQKCPHIEKRISTMQAESFWAPVTMIQSHMFTDEGNIKLLLRFCEATYDCPGPIAREKTIIKPRNPIQILRGQEAEVELETFHDCGAYSDREAQDVVKGGK